jgi:hypothetical protein
MFQFFWESLAAGVSWGWMAKGWRPIKRTDTSTPKELAPLQAKELAPLRAKELAPLRTLSERDDAPQLCVEPVLDERRLRFARWLVEHGKLSEDV